jgi:hypothetical protein
MMPRRRGRTRHVAAIAPAPEEVPAPPPALSLSFMAFRQKLILFHP